MSELDLALNDTKGIVLKYIAELRLLLSDARKVIERQMEERVKNKAKIAELEAANIKLEYTNRGLVEWAHKHNAGLEKIRDAAQAVVYAIPMIQRRGKLWTLEQRLLDYAALEGDK